MGGKPEVNLTGMQSGDSGASLEFEGGACQVIAEAFAEQFVGSGAVNYLEMTFTSEERGSFVVTMQKVGGMTPAEKVAKIKVLIREGKLEEALAL